MTYGGWSPAAAHIAALLIGRNSGGEDNLPGSKIVICRNERGVSEFRLTFYKCFDDSLLLDEQWLFYFPRVYQPHSSRCFLPALDNIQLFDDKIELWRGRTKPASLIWRCNHWKILRSGICRSGNFVWYIHRVALPLPFARTYMYCSSIFSTHVKSPNVHDSKTRNGTFLYWNTSCWNAARQLLLYTGQI